MTTSAKRPASRSQPDAVQTSKGTAAVPGASCPRCNTRLRLSYDELECLGCGYVDYEYSPERRPKTGVVGSATRYVVRYTGDSLDLSDTVTHVQLRFVRNRLGYGVQCPFCGIPMSPSLLSRRRGSAGEERYTCAAGHRVSLTKGDNGVVGWK